MSAYPLAPSDSGTPPAYHPEAPAGVAPLTGPDATAAWRRQLTVGLALSDAAAVAVALVVAHIVRFGASAEQVPAVDVGYTSLAIVIGAAWFGSLALLRSRDRRVLGAGSSEYARVARATFLTFGVLAIAAFVVGIDIARGYLAIALPVGLVLLLVSRHLWRSWLVARRREGGFLTSAVIVGNGRDVRRALAQVDRNPGVGYRSVGVAITDPEGVSVMAGDLARVAVDDLVRLVHTERVGAVILAGDLPGGAQQIRELGWELENSGVELILLSQLTDVAGPRIHLRPVDGLPMVHVDLPRFSGIDHLAKRGLDLVLASIGLLVLAPVLAAVAVAVRVDSAGPVLFRQERVGAQGRAFTMFKFRSMVVDAEARKAELSAVNEGAGVLFKMRADPRVTRVGRVLRAFSLDELPQLINVVLGDMSLVGPRPPLQSEVDRYEKHATRRLLIKPGITGMWQVSGRSNLTWDESVRLDLWYVENWSIVGDFQIIGKTVRAVLARDGAY